MKKLFGLLVLIGSALAFASPEAFVSADSSMGSGKLGIASGVQACVDTTRAGIVGIAAVSLSVSQLSQESDLPTFCLRLRGVLCCGTTFCGCGPTAVGANVTFGRHHHQRILRAADQGVYNSDSHRLII